MARDWTRYPSTIDASVNFVCRTEDGGAFEARFVQRDPGYFITYLSSQTGCDQACRFCHLTQLGQTMRQQAGLPEFLEQAEQVIAHHDARPSPARKMHVNFMARGEPLLNPLLTRSFSALADPLTEMAAARGLEIRFNLSTIFPRETAGLDLAQSFKGYPVTFYWSLYSLEDRFRRRWLPKADSPEASLRRLLDWQTATGREVVIHHALIAGENDTIEQMQDIRDLVAGSGLRTRLNLVRYNSFGPRTGTEADETAYAAAAEILGNIAPTSRAKIVPRVGRDVAASCGMFMA